LKRNLARHVETHAGKSATRHDFPINDAALVPVSCSPSTSGEVFRCLANNCYKVFSTEEQVRSHQALVHESQA
jgi:hypothetical protein